VQQRHPASEAGLMEPRFAAGGQTIVIAAGMRFGASRPTKLLPVAQVGPS
jgi:hypothetical protein